MYSRKYSVFEKDKNKEGKSDWKQEYYETRLNFKKSSFLGEDKLCCIYHFIGENFFKLLDNLIRM